MPWDTRLWVKTFTNQNFLFSMFYVDKSNFQKINIYVNKATLLIFDIFIKFNDFIRTNIQKIMFDFITYSIVTWCFYCVFPKESLTCPQDTILPVSANSLQTWLSMHLFMCTSVIHNRARAYSVWYCARQRVSVLALRIRSALNRSWNSQSIFWFLQWFITSLLALN